MRDFSSRWKLTDKITNERELEQRVCQALAPHVTRYRDGDIPFINGHRVDFWTAPKFSWRAGSWRLRDGNLSAMSDVAEVFFICMLIKKRFFYLATWTELQQLMEKQCDPETTPETVTTWGDVIAIVEKMFLKALAPGKLPWVIARENTVARRCS